MGYTKICLLVVFVVAGVTYFKQENQNISFLLKLCCGVFLGLYVVDKIFLFYEEYQGLLAYLKDYSVYIKLFLKALGICYICEFVANVAKEEGLVNLSAQIELLGKLSVFSLGIPVLMSLFNYLEQFF